jgi:hypothetical protein
MSAEPNPETKKQNESGAESVRNASQKILNVSVPAVVCAFTSVRSGSERGSRCPPSAQ